jgi:hypothetical protein
MSDACPPTPRLRGDEQTTFELVLRLRERTSRICSTDDGAGEDVRKAWDRIHDHDLVVLERFGVKPLRDDESPKFPEPPAPSTLVRRLGGTTYTLSLLDHLDEVCEDDAEPELPGRPTVKDAAILALAQGPGTVAELLPRVNAIRPETSSGALSAALNDLKAEGGAAHTGNRRHYVWHLCSHLQGG